MKKICIHITDQCNQSCNFCVMDCQIGQPNQVDIKDVHKFLEEQADKGIETVNIHGGEPTLTSDLIAVLEKIKELEYPKVQIQTNGLLLSNMDYVRTLSSKGIDLFIISLHGSNAYTNDGITQVTGSFERVVQAIKNVKKIGKKVRTNTVVCKQNSTDLINTVKLAMDLGTDHVNISAIHPMGKAFRKFYEVTPRYSEIIQYVKKAVNMVVKRNIPITLEAFTSCVLGEYDRYMIDWNENNYKMQFHSEVIENYREFMTLEMLRTGQACTKCIKREFCGGVYKEYANFYGWDEFFSISSKDAQTIA